MGQGFSMIEFAYNDNYQARSMDVSHPICWLKEGAVNIIKTNIVKEIVSSFLFFV